MLLTDLLREFIAVFSFGYARLLPDAMALLSLLAALEICLVGIWWAFGDGQGIEVDLLKRVLQIGFFVWVITNYAWLIEIIVGGFISVGEKAGGMKTGELLTNPSAIVDYGFKATDPIFLLYKDNYNPFSLPNQLLAFFAGLLVLMSYFVIAIIVFITYLEFYIVSVLGLILVPFGVFKHTTFISEKVFGGVVSYGIRFMVLAFILAVVEPVLAKPQSLVDPSFHDMFLLLVTSLTIAGLSWHAPSIASGLLAGAPSLTPGSALGTAIAAGVGLGGIGAAASGVAKVGAAKTKAAAGAIASRFRDGGGSNTGQNIKPSTQISGNTTRTPSTAVSSSKGSAGMPNWAQNVLLAQRAIPNESHPSASVSPTFK